FFRSRLLFHRSAAGGAAGLAGIGGCPAPTPDAAALECARLAGTGRLGAGVFLLESRSDPGGRRDPGHHEQRPDSRGAGGQPVDLESTGRSAPPAAGRRGDRPVTLVESTLGQLAGADQKISINRPMMTSRPTRKMIPTVLARNLSITTPFSGGVRFRPAHRPDSSRHDLNHRIWAVRG